MTPEQKLWYSNYYNKESLFIDLTGKDRSNITVAIDSGYIDKEFSLAVCVMESTPRGNNIIGCPVFRLKIMTTIDANELLNKVYRHYEGCKVLREVDEKEIHNKYYKGKKYLDEWMLQSRLSIPLKTNNMNPETEQVLLSNLDTQQEKLNSLKDRKEFIIQDLVSTQQDIERQEKYLEVLTNGYLNIKYPDRENKMAASSDFNSQVKGCSMNQDEQTVKNQSLHPFTDKGMNTDNNIKKQP